MKRLRKFFRHPPEDRLLLIKAAILLGVIVLGLALLPFKVVLTRVNGVRVKRGWQNGTKSIPENRIIWAVSKVSRHIPNTKCLATAMAVKVLYTREGYPAELRIGVEKIGDKQIKAHAWVESRGEIVIGNMDDLARYKELPSLEGNNS